MDIIPNTCDSHGKEYGKLSGSCSHIGEGRLLSPFPLTVHQQKPSKYSELEWPLMVVPVRRKDPHDYFLVLHDGGWRRSCITYDARHTGSPRVSLDPNYPNSLTVSYSIGFRVASRSCCSDLYLHVSSFCYQRRSPSFWGCPLRVLYGFGKLLMQMWPVGTLNHRTWLWGFLYISTPNPKP